MIPNHVDGSRNQVELLANLCFLESGIKPSLLILYILVHVRKILSRDM